MTILPTTHPNLTDAERAAARGLVTLRHLLHARLLHGGQRLYAIRYDGQDANHTQGVHGRLPEHAFYIEFDGRAATTSQVAELVRDLCFHPAHINVTDGWEYIYIGVTPTISLHALREFYLDKIGTPDAPEIR